MPNLRIVFEGQCFQTKGSSRRGIGIYSAAILRAFAEAFDSHECFILLNRGLPEPVQALPKTMRALYLQYPDPDPFSPLNHRFLRWWIRSLQPDAVHLLSPIDIGEAVIPHPSQCPEVPFVGTLYDLIPLLFEKTYLSDEIGRKMYYRHLDIFRSCARVVAISECSRKDGIERLGLDPARTLSLPFGFPPMAPPAGEQEVRARFDLQGPFVLMVGGEDPRKNMKGAMAAFAGLPEALRESHALVITCSLSPAEEQRLRRTAQELGIEERIVLTNYVSPEELSTLYKMSRAFLFPSLYEGLGLPVLEAMAFGTPVVASNTSSIPEVAGDAGLLSDPSDPANFARHLAALLSDEALRQDYSRRALEWARSLSWKRTAERLEAVYRSCQPSETAVRVRHRLPKIAYFSPLAPCQSGIADYSEDLLPLLARHFEITLVTDRYEPSSPSIRDRFPFLPYDTFEKEDRFGDFDHLLYQIGNSRFHEYMLDAQRHRPGLVVLHDFSLHSFIHFLTLLRGSPEAYIREMEYAHGEAGAASAREVVAGIREPEIDRFPIHRRVLERATGVIVHSKWAKARIETEGLFVPVRRIEHLVPRYDPIPREEARRDLGISPGTFLVAAFGFMAATKQIESGLAGFAQLRKLVPDSRFVCVGECSPPGYRKVLEAVAREQGVQDAFRITDFVDVGEFRRWSAACDACLNLRWPYLGETSGSLLRVMAFGVPSIVHDLGAFSELPDEAVAKIPRDGNEPESIARILKKWASDKEERLRIGRNAARFVRESCAPERIAEEYRGFIDLLLAERGARSLARVAFEGHPDGEAAIWPEAIAQTWLNVADLRLSTAIQDAPSALTTGRSANPPPAGEDEELYELLRTKRIFERCWERFRRGLDQEVLLNGGLSSRKARIDFNADGMPRFTSVEGDGAVFGPYKPLDPGRYAVRFDYVIGGARSSPISFDVAMQSGTTVLWKQNLSPEPGLSSLQGIFYVGADLSNSLFETRVFWGSPMDSITIESVLLRRIMA